MLDKSTLEPTKQLIKHKMSQIDPPADNASLSKVISEQDELLRSQFAGRYINDTGKAEQILNKIRSSPNTDISTTQTIILDNQDTGIPVETFIIDLQRKKSGIPDIYLTILDRLELQRSLVNNKDALSENRGGWLAFTK